MTAPGQIIDNRYRVERIIGRGAMGAVLAATHLQLGQRVAIKVMLPQRVASERAAARFEREARLAARLTTEHVARVFDIGVLRDGALYIVMEYLEGEDLASWLAARGAMPVAVAVDYALQVLLAMAEAHRLGIVHRDLKPANCFVTRRADGRALLKVLDFGIAKSELADVRLTHSAALLGTPRYMSPEQMRGSHTVDARADVWSLGVILYEMVTGQVPFVGDSFPELAMRVHADPMPPLPGPPDAVRDGFAAVIRRCLEKQPAARFQSVAALAAALAPFGPPGAAAAARQVASILGVSPASSGEPPPGARASTDAGRADRTAPGAGGARRRRRPAVLVGAAVLAVAGFALAGLMATDEPAAGAPDAPLDAGRAQQAAAAGPEPVLAKIAGYIACVNELSEMTLGRRDRYRESGFAATGPHGRDVSAPGRIPDPASCEARIAAARKMAPSEPALERAGDAYAAALRALFPVLADADEYYAQELYKDDAFAKGKALHPRLTEAFDAFARADGELRGELRRIGRAARARELARIEASEGRSPRFCAANVMLCAEDLVAFAHARSIAAIDGAALGRAIDTCKPALEELEAEAARAGGGPGATRSAMPINAEVYQQQMYTADMIEEAKKLVRRAKEVARHVAGTVRYTDFELRNLGNPDLVGGSPAGMIEAYNRLVRAANLRPHR